MDHHQQAREAALAVVHPDTDPTTRSAASQFLEQWTNTDEAWTTYCQWLSNCQSHELPLILLCLQLLQTKIRRTTQSSHFGLVQSTLSHFLNANPPESTVQPACICVAALAVRSGQPTELLGFLQNNNAYVSVIELRILQNVPLELEAASELTSSQVSQQLQTYPASECLCRTIQQQSDDIQLLLCAVSALNVWIRVGRITLSQLHATTNVGNGSTSLLWLLIQLLSQATVPDEAVYVQTAQALQEAIQVPTDSCTDSRNAACAVLLRAITETGFLKVPLQQRSEWEDAAVAVATLASTFVTEEIDILIVEPATDLLHLLLQLQVHPLIQVRMAILECWLTASEVSLRERHDHWKSPLFEQITAAILKTIEYNEEVDEDNLIEYRRMVGDVLVASYFLLRADYLQHLVHTIISSTPLSAEAALFTLTATSREINARIKSRTTGANNDSLLNKDKTRTSELLLQTVRHICHCNVEEELFVIGVAKFLGSFAASWSVLCTAEDIFTLLVYLQNVLLHYTGKDILIDQIFGSPIPEAAKAIKLVMVNTFSTLLATADINTLRQCTNSVMEAVLSSRHKESMLSVAEGCTRLIIQSNNEEIRNRLLVELVGAVLPKAITCLDSIPVDITVVATEQTELAIELLCSYLHVIQTIIRFCDSPDFTVSNNPVAGIMENLSPFLDRVSQQASRYDLIFSKVLGIQEQLLKNAPSLVAPHFQQSVKYVVEAFEIKNHIACLEYFATAVEAVGSHDVDTFRDLLNHVTTIVFSILQQHGPESNAAIVKGFFEMVQRYILFCPSALVGSHQFSNIVACAVECLFSCKSERESTRSVLNFLTRLFGWKTLRLSNEAMAILQSAAPTLDEQTLLHGARTLQICMSTIFGGSQALWPACTDCIFALVVASVAWPVPEDDSCVAQKWLLAAVTSSVANVDVDLANTVIRLLLDFARDGPKSKSRAKMLLTDFCLIHKGDLSSETLVSYRL